MQFLGIKISEVSKEQALERVSEFLSGGLSGEALAKTGQHTIFTPNPEMIVRAQTDEYFKKVLNAGDLNLCDGMGLQMAINLSPSAREGVVGVGANTSATPPSPPLGKRRIERIAGVDFMLEICKLAAEQKNGVYLLGSGSDEVIKKTAENLQTQFPNLKIAGYDKGPIVSEQNPTPYPSPYRGGSETPLSTVASPPIRGRTEEGVLVNDNNSTIQQINQSKPDILFVAFGMGKQEKWIYENLSKMPSVKITMGVGGSFDFISGKIKRAPLFLRQLGLEWIYRLIQEPQRFGRIFNATVKFAYLVLKSKFLISNVKSNPND